MQAKGNLHKMKTQYQVDNEVTYTLTLEGEDIVVNNFIGQSIKLEYQGIINCVNCGRVTKSSFFQGFCYTCFTNSPQASECIIRPELCKAHLGKGRDPEWEEKNHNQPHAVYLALSSAVKVGITRDTQIPTRWIDQGASEAIKIAETPNRYLAGVLEVALKGTYTDKTHWQKMLKNEIATGIDLEEEKWQLEDVLPADYADYFTEDDEVLQINYPVIRYPSKVKSINLDKTPIIEEKLIGIKGQYLIFDNDTVINIRKYSGYHINIDF